MTATALVSQISLSWEALALELSGRSFVLCFTFRRLSSGAGFVWKTGRRISFTHESCPASSGGDKIGFVGSHKSSWAHTDTTHTLARAHAVITYGAAAAARRK